MRRSLFCLAALCSHLVVFAQTPPGTFQIQWITNESAVRVSGPIPRELQSSSSEKLQEIFPVTVEPENVLHALGLPPMVGSYSATAKFIQFQPRFPLEPGVTYRATFEPAHLSSVLHLPRPSMLPTTIVTTVYPSADAVPQNLLKFYLHFSAPMSRGHIYEHIHLADESGAAVELPFLEIDEELWSPDMTRLTLFLDPGRIKRGVRPLEEVGPALLPGRSYTLRVDNDWPDAKGSALKASFTKKFHVTPPDREPPNPADWRITPPSANTREPLAIVFSDPMDEALALRMISVKSVPGRSSLTEQERRWLFAPDQPWKPGRYELLIQTTIEDLAGNNIGKPFEVDLQEGVRPPDTARSLSLHFTVR